jgi:CRP-like cAMP-binding protein
MISFYLKGDRQEFVREESMKEGHLGKHYSDGDIIFREGENADQMYIIQSGKVEISKAAPSGDIALAMFKGGDIFGEMALFDRMPRSATAVARGDTFVLSIDKKKLFQSINSDPTLAFKVMNSMSSRIRHMNEGVMKLKSTLQSAKNLDDVHHITDEMLSQFDTLTD